MQLLEIPGTSPRMTEKKTAYPIALRITGRARI
jgi:hypothetical protein